jgi:putative ABC transport system substrate-binding protein
VIQFYSGFPVRLTLGQPFSLVICIIMLFSFEICAESQQQKKVPRIGYLMGTREPTPDAPDANRDAFRRGLRDLGYIEGENVVIDYRYGAVNEDRAAKLAFELIQLNVDLIVSPTLPGIQAAKQATKAIPIVMVINQDPVATGMVESLARPGGNITGVTRLTRELSGKRLELIKEIVPTASRVGILLADTTSGRNSYKDYDAPARALKLELQPIEVQSLKPNFDGAFRIATKGRASAIITLRNPLLIDNRKRIAELAIQNRLPSISEGSVFVHAGTSRPAHPTKMIVFGEQLCMSIRF